MKILVVDDSPDILRALARTLTHRGYEVKACSDHVQAIADAKWADVVLVDVDMPERSGPELVQFFPTSLPVVYHTGNPEGVPRGARYVQKPAGVDEIIQALLDEAGTVR